MGCGHSKTKLPRGGVRASAAVALCRDRSALLAEAIARRYALADAHRAYAASLSATGAALHDFLRAVPDATPLPLPEPDEAPDGDAEAAAAAPEPAAPPILVAPDAEEADDDDDDGHIHFCLDKGETSDDCHGGSHTKPDPEPTLTRTADAEQLNQETLAQPPQTAAPPPQPPHMAASPRPQAPQMAVPYNSAHRPTPQTAYPPPPPLVPASYVYDYPPPPYTYSSYNLVLSPSYGYAGGYNQSSYDINYTQSHPLPSLVSYHQGTYVTDASVRYHYHQCQGLSDAIPSSNSHCGGYPYQYYSQSPQQWPPVSSVSSSHQLPPPSPPMESAWGFLDPFEALERYYQDHPVASAAHSSNDVRNEDEDMPELEEDTDIPELQEDKECSSSITTSEDEMEQHIEFKDSSSDATSSSNRNMVHGNVVEKGHNAVEEQLEEHSGVAETEPPIVVAPEEVYNNDVEVVQEIKLQFEQASKSADDVCKMLEVGKMPHSQKNSVFKVSSVMICGVPSKRKKFLKFEEEKAMECGNLSSSLQQLYWWEKKLLQEVKSTEKIRAMHEHNCKILKKMYDSGAEAHKLEQVEVSIKKLLPRIDVAIRIVNAISDKINKLRDEELWPQTHEIIRGFMQMWDVMSKCHHIQCHSMSQAKNIDSTMAAAKFSEAHMHLVKQLELQLLDMTTSFAAWFSAQKSYVITLNEWLKRGIMYEPEVTDDGVVPFSPGCLGAPPIFTICNSWAASLERISDAEVVCAMQALASSVLGLWEKHRSEWRKGVLAHSTNLEKDLRALDRDDLWMRRAVESRKKKLVLVCSLRGVYVSNAQAIHDNAPPPSEDGMQPCMSKVFEAIQSFTTACGDVYKDLHIRSEEENASFASATCVDADKHLCLCSGGGEEASVTAAFAKNADIVLKVHDTALHNVGVEIDANGERAAHT